MIDFSKWTRKQLYDFNKDLEKKGSITSKNPIHYESVKAFNQKSSLEELWDDVKTSPNGAPEAVRELEYRGEL